MKKLLILIPVVLISIFVISKNTKGKVMPATDSVYDYSVNDIDGNEVSLDMSAVNAKATELENSHVDVKASAKQKLINGEPLTEEEADTIVL